MILTILVRKNRRLLELPLKEKALCVVKGWHGIRKCDYVFYNPETGGQWKNLWLGLKKSCRKANFMTSLHTFRHVRTRMAFFYATREGQCQRVPFRWSQLSEASRNHLQHLRRPHRPCFSR